MLNADLRGLRDGSQRLSVELARIDGRRREIGRIRVYWPFVVFKTDRDVWNVTHAPTGRNVLYHGRMNGAIAAVKKLRGAADFEFTSLRSLKWKQARKRTRKIRQSILRSA